MTNVLKQGSARIGSLGEKRHWCTGDKRGFKENLLLLVILYLSFDEQYFIDFFIFNDSWNNDGPTIFKQTRSFLEAWMDKQSTDCLIV